MDSLSIYELLFHLVSWTLATESSWALDSGEWCTWSTHASNVFKSQQNPTEQNYQKQTKYTFTASRRLNQAIMNQKTSEISNGQSALSHASIVIPQVHSSYFKLFSKKDKIMAIPYFHSIFSSDCQHSYGDSLLVELVSASKPKSNESWPACSFPVQEKI